MAVRSATRWTYQPQTNKTFPMKELVSSAPLLAKYLRLRREWSVADPVSGLHHRLSHEIAQLELDFVEMGVSPFVDTQPFERWSVSATNLDKCWNFGRSATAPPT